jgi:hypothetical protein
VVISISEGVLMSVESFTSPGMTVSNGYVDAIIWEGLTSEGDTVQIISGGPSGKKFWAGRASGTQTYQGISFPGAGQKAANGLWVSQISSGVVYIYFKDI